MKSSPSPSSGFTLLELMMVLAVIGIVCGMAVADHLASLPEKRMKWAVQRLIGDIHAARMVSASRNSRCRLEFDTQAGAYRQETEFTDPVTGARSWLASDRPRALADPESPYYLKNVLIDTVSQTLVCNPDGSLVASTVTFKNDRGDRVSVTVSDAGRIRVE